MTPHKIPSILVSLTLACSSTSVRQVEPDSPDPVAAIAIEVYADGRDADQPPGLRISEGETVEWTYVAVNAGTVELVGVVVEDDVWGTVSCARDAINPGEQTLCSLVAAPPSGLFESTGTVTGTTPDGEIVTASDVTYVLVDPIATLAPGEVRPVACATHLLMANPTRDTLTALELSTRTVAAIAVGDEPLDLAVAEDCSVAVTLNQGGDSISVVHLGAATSSEVTVRPGRNRLSLSPNGSWLVVWADPEREGIGCVGTGTCPLGEVSVVDLDNLTVDDFATGMSPFDVLFADTNLAVIAGETSLGLVELAAGAVTFGRQYVNTASAEEAVVSPSGEYVWMRDFAESTLVVATLSPFATNSIGVGPPSDMELSANGSELLVLAPSSDQLLIFDTSDPLAVPTPAVELGSFAAAPQLRLNPAADRGVIFDAGLVDRVWVWRRGDILGPTSAVKPIRDAMLTPDGTAGLVIHTLADVDGADDEYTDEYVLSLIDIESFPLPSANVVVLPAKPIAWTIAPTGGWAIVLCEESTELLVIDFATMLTDVVALPSPGQFAAFLPNTGTVDEDVAWVSHALDISFVSPASGTVETVVVP